MNIIIDNKPHKLEAHQIYPSQPGGFDAETKPYRSLIRPPSCDHMSLNTFTYSMLLFTCYCT